MYVYIYIYEHTHIYTCISLSLYIYIHTLQQGLRASAGRLAGFPAAGGGRRAGSPIIYVYIYMYIYIYIYMSIPSNRAWLPQ